MALSCGIVGLPNVGKSTLFNALLKKQVALAANYPFATIEPNVGVVGVPDSRLDRLAQVITDSAKQSPPIIAALVEFYDIAGLVRGASQGEGLGNKFLSHIKEVDAIIHVVRLFEDAQVLRHTDPGSQGHSDPGSDIEIVETELILADLSTLSRQSRPNKKIEKEEALFYDTVELLKQKLDEGTPARAVELADKEREAAKQLNLLTAKPVLYVYNVSENQLSSLSSHPEPIQSDNSLYLSAKLENEIVALDPADQQEYLQQYGLQEPGLDRLIKAGYTLLGLISFLTAGVKEVRAWTITKGTNAQQAAGVIHTDFIKHFIKADVIPFDEFVRTGGWTPARDQGLVKSMGRDYVIQDGDVVEFRVGV